MTCKAQEFGRVIRIVAFALIPCQTVLDVRGGKVADKSTHLELLAIEYIQQVSCCALLEALRS